MSFDAGAVVGKLGLDIGEFTGGMLKVTDGIAGMGTTADQVKSSMALLGRGGADGIAAINMGSAGLKEQASIFTALGGTIDTSMAKAGDKVKTLESRFGAAWDGIKNKAMTPIMQYVADHADQITAALLSATSAMSSALASVGPAIIGAGERVMDFGQSIHEWGTGAVLKLESDWTIAPGIQPSVNAGLMSHKEFDQIAGDLRQDLTVQFFFDDPESPAVELEQHRIVDVEAVQMGTPIDEDGDPGDYRVIEYRVYVADARQRFVKPRGGFIARGEINKKPFAKDEDGNEVDANKTSILQAEELIDECLTAMGIVDDTFVADMLFGSPRSPTFSGMATTRRRSWRSCWRRPGLSSPFFPMASSRSCSPARGKSLTWGIWRCRRWRSPTSTVAARRSCSCLRR